MSSSDFNVTKNPNGTFNVVLTNIKKGVYEVSAECGKYSLTSNTVTVYCGYVLIEANSPEDWEQLHFGTQNAYRGNGTPSTQHALPVGGIRGWYLKTNLSSVTADPVMATLSVKTYTKAENEPINANTVDVYAASSFLNDGSNTVWKGDDFAVLNTTATGGTGNWIPSPEAPTYGSTPLGSFDVDAAEYESAKTIDVTAYVKQKLGTAGDKAAAFYIDTQGGVNTSFFARSNANNCPVLRLYYEPSVIGALNLIQILVTYGEHNELLDITALPAKYHQTGISCMSKRTGKTTTEVLDEVGFIGSLDSSVKSAKVLLWKSYASVLPFFRNFQADL